jgi:septal ring factor EnvC (AmiA/AmiB activator)
LPGFDPAAPEDETPMTAAEFGLNPNKLEFCNLGQAITAIEADFNRMARGHRNLARQVKEQQEIIEQLLAEKEQLVENQMDNSLLVNQHLRIEELDLRVIELSGELEVWQQLASENEEKAERFEEERDRLQNELAQSKAQLEAIFAGALNFMGQQGKKPTLELVK